MHFYQVLPLLVAAVAALPAEIASRSDSGFVTVHPGWINELTETEHNVLHGVYHTDKTSAQPASSFAAAASVGLELINNDVDGVKAYIQGLDSQNRIVFVGADGNLIYPSSGGSQQNKPVDGNIAIELGAKGQTTTVNVNTPIHSGRIYYARGDLHFFIHFDPATGGDALVQPDFVNPSDPSAGIKWSFTEFTLNPDGSIYANLSYVDFVSVESSMKLTTNDGQPEQYVAGLKHGGAFGVAFAMHETVNGGMPWAQLVQSNGPGILDAVRTVSPAKVVGHDDGYFQNFFSQYVDAVYSRYSTSALTIDTQGLGKVDCHVSGDVLRCDRSDRDYPKPSSADIWGCNSGPFVVGDGNDVHQKIVPRLCAAFYRQTLLLDGGNVQPSLPASSYYPKTSESSSQNLWGHAIHVLEADGKGYAFSYDDVNPDGENASGTVSSGAPRTLTVWVGGNQ